MLFGVNRVSAEDSLYAGYSLKEGAVVDQLVMPSFMSCSCGMEQKCAPDMHIEPCQTVAKDVQGECT